MKKTALKRKTPLKAKTCLKAKPPKKEKKPKVKPLGDRIKSQKGKTWAAASLYIRTRDPICVTCKKNPATQAGHYKHNSDKQNKQLGGNALWYDERNLGGQCTRCNCYNSGELDLFAVHLEETYGHGILQELETLFNTAKKWTIEELIEVEHRYGKMLDQLP